MDINRENLLRQVMAADFMVIEMNLYLNTHPTEQRAIALFNSSVQRAKMLRDMYERTYGPLTPFYTNNKNTWQWIESPWPWEGR